LGPQNCLLTQHYDVTTNPRWRTAAILKIVFGHNSAVDYPISVAKQFFSEFQQWDMYTCFPQQRICCIGNRQISTSHKIDTPELINKKSAQLITSTRNPLYQIWYKSTSSGLLGKWVKYNKKYYYLYLFLLRFAYRSDPWMDFYTRQLKRREITRRCAFWGSNFSKRFPPEWWGKTPGKKLKFWRRE